MAPWLKITLDISVLAFLGLLYYFIQRRRIIKNDLGEIFHFLEKAIYQSNEFLDNKQDKQFYSRVNSFIESLEKSLEGSDINLLNESLNSIPSELPEEVQIQLREIKNSLSLHIK